MKKVLSWRFGFLLAAMQALIMVTTASAYITTLSAPVFSTDTSDPYLYFQGPNNYFYKVASDSPEIVIASDDPDVNPVTWSDSDLTATAATRLGAGSGGLFPDGATISSSPSVPGDGYCYFREQTDALARIKTDGTSFSRFGVTTPFSPAASGGSVYFFSRVGSFADPKLYRLPTGSLWPSGKVDLGAFGFSAPVVTGDGRVYFQGGYRTQISNVLSSVSISGAGLQGPNLFTDNSGIHLQIGSPPDVYGSAIYFQRADGLLCYISTGGSHFGITAYRTSTTPYAASDGCLYFLNDGNEMFQAVLATGVVNDLYIQAVSTPTSYSNGDGTITLFFQGNYNGHSALMKFTPPTP